MSTDWNKIAEIVRKSANATQYCRIFDALSSAADLCERMAKGELVEAPKPCTTCAGLGTVLKHINSSGRKVCPDCRGENSALLATSDPTPSEREHCYRTAENMPDDPDGDEIVQLLLRERAAVRTAYNRAIERALDVLDEDHVTCAKACAILREVSGLRRDE